MSIERGYCHSCEDMTVHYEETCVECSTDVVEAIPVPMKHKET